MFQPVSFGKYHPTNGFQTGSNVPAAEERIKNLQKMREEALACHNIAMQRMAERMHGTKFIPWKIGNKVWLSAAHLLIKLPSWKLAPKRYGPFEVVEVLSPITFKLRLPKTWKVHPTFHASELSSYRETDVHGPNATNPPPDLIDGEEEYEVEAIISHMTLHCKIHYLVSWSGYDASENSWLPESALKNSPTILKRYKDRLKISRILSPS